MNPYNESIQKIMSSWKKSIEPILKFQNQWDMAMEPIRTSLDSFANIQTAILNTTYSTYNFQLQELQANLNQLTITMNECLSPLRIGMLDTFYKNLNTNFAESFQKLDGLNSFSEILKSSTAELFSLEENVNVADFDDYITVDEDPIREFEIPEAVAIPIGHNRLKIKTDFFIALMGIIISAIISLSALIADQIESNSVESTTQQEEEIQLMQEQNQILYQLLISVDSSMSSQTGAIEDLKESLQAPDSDSPDSVEFPDSCKQTTDNKNESPNTEPEN